MQALIGSDNVARMSTPPSGWSLQRPFEKETTAAEWFESTDIPLMAVVRGITEIPARSLEVTANYACILATGKRCDGSDPTPEDLESGYYSLMPGGAKGAKGITQAAQAKGTKFFKGFKTGRNQQTKQIGKFTEFSTDVPGRVSGSYTRWVKVVDENGRTVRLYHDTFDKTGKFIHRGIKVPGPERHVP